MEMKEQLIVLINDVLQTPAYDQIANMDELN